MWGRKKHGISRQRPSGSTLQSDKQTVYSYYNNVPASKQPALAEKVIMLADKPRSFRLIPTIVAISVIAISFLISLTLSTSANVHTTQEDQSSPYRELNEYSLAMDEILSSKLSYRTKFTINTKEAEQELLTRFPELDAAVLRLPVLGRRPTLVVAVSQPALLLAAQSKSYVLDDDGVAVSTAQNVSAQTRQSLLVIRDESGLEVVEGKQVVTSDTITFIKSVIAQLKAQSLEVNQLTLPPNANQLNIRLKGLPYTIKTDVAGDARQQIGSYLAVREHLSGQGITPAEYVDVRVEEKVFYK